MKESNSDDLIAYLYDEADESTRFAVEERLKRCAETRAQVAEWRATMATLDRWEIEDKATPAPSFAQRFSPVLKVAAAIAVLLGAGVWIGQQMRGSASDGSATIAAAPPVSTSAPKIQVNEVENHIIMASAAMTHRQVQAHLQEALKHLEANSMRNETLAVFLPPKEQVAYQEGAQALKTVAEGVDKESTRREDFTKQIIARARARAAQKH